MDYERALRPSGEGCEMDIMVSTRSKRTALDGVDPWRERALIRVRSPPLDGRANKEIEGYLEELFGVAASIVRGHTARMKTVFIALSVEEALQALEKL